MPATLIYQVASRSRGEPNFVDHLNYWQTPAQAFILQGSGLDEPPN